MPRPAWFGYGFVGFAGVQKMSSSAGGAPTAEDALQILEAPILRWLYVRRNPRQAFNIDFGARGGAAVRRVGRAGPQGRRPRPARRPGAGLRAGRRDTDGRAAAHAAGRRSRSGCCPRSPTSPPATRSRSAGSSSVGHPHASVADLEPRLTRAMDLDPRLRARVRPHHGPRRRRTSSGSSSLSEDEHALAGPAPRPPARHAGPRVDHRAGLRRTEARPRPRPRRPADRPGQGRPEGVLQAALQPAGRRRPRPPAADAVPGPRQRPGAGAAHSAARLTARAGGVSSSTAVLPSRRTSSTHSPSTPAPFSWVTSTIPAPRPGRL